jgi:FMN-dependent NADH-azoreductase
MAAYDFVAPYLRATLGFLGLTDMEVVRVEGTAIPDLAAEALPKAIASIQV